MNKRWKAIHCTILILVVLSVLVLDINLIRHINSKSQEGYSVENYGSGKSQIQEGDLETWFQAVSSELLFLNFWCEAENGIEGKISYRVLDEQGAYVYEKRDIEASDVWDHENQCLHLDIVGEDGYKAGKMYHIIISFQLKEPLGIVLDRNGMMHTQWYQVDYQGIMYALLIALNVFLAGALGIFYKWGWNHKLFLGMSLIVGIFAVILTPPFSRDDEFRHFVRAYDLSYGGHVGYYEVPQAGSVGNIFADEEGRAQMIEIPREISELRLVDYGDNYNARSYLAEVNTALCIPRLQSVFVNPETDETVEVSQVATVGKGLESYWPQVIFILLGRLFGVRSGLLYYLAGLGQVLATSLMLWIALRISNKYQNLIWMLGFIPQTTLFRGSSNPDGLMITEIILCLAVVLHLREAQINLIQKKGAVLSLLYLILLIQIFMIKLPYALLCMGFLLFLKRENFSFVPWHFLKKHCIIISIASGIVIVIAGVYFLVVQKGELFLNIIYTFVPEEYVSYILEHFKEICVLFLISGGKLLKETIWSVRGSYYISYNFIVLFVLLFSEKRFNVRYKLYQVFLFLCMLGVIVLVGYTLTPPDYGRIWGITYRYMLPVLPVLWLALPFGNEKTECIVSEIYPPVLIVTIFASCLPWMWY